jgi:hypothetical protein
MISRLAMRRHLAHTYESAFVEWPLAQSVSCRSPDHIRLWLQRVRGHLGVHRRVRPRPGGNHSDRSQILSILLGGIRQWHIDLIMILMALSKVDGMYGTHCVLSRGPMPTSTH